MILHSATPYWLMKNGYSVSFPALTGDLRTEVCVLGAGITGALAADALAREGVDVVVLDKRHPGMGSTCASTALLQYEIDEPLHRLIETVGRKRAEASYLACYRAIDGVKARIESEKLPVAFTKTPSLQYASRKKHARDLKKEFAARRHIGLDVRFREGTEVRDSYGFTPPAALWSSQGAQVDAFQLALALLGRRLGNLKVFDTCKAVSIEEGRNGVVVKTGDGHRVRARNLVVACGYESGKFLRKNVLELSSTYAIASKPMTGGGFWPDRSLIWETKTPYMYVRTTDDNRVILGGRDDHNFAWGKGRASLAAKRRGLTADFAKLFPNIPMVPDFVWAGAFGGTRDSLPYVGRPDGMKRTHFILGFGGNGIVFSQTGSEIVRDAILGRRNSLASLYEFSR